MQTQNPAAMEMWQRQLTFMHQMQQHPLALLQQLQQQQLFAQQVRLF